MARYWGMCIKIDGTWLRENDNNYTRWLGRDPAAWEADVQGVCRKIESAGKTGKLLMRLINKMEGKKVIIMPVHAASFHQTQIKPADFTDAIKRDYRFTCPADQFCSKANPAQGAGIAPHSQLLRGTGTGVNVRLYYHPGSWTSHDQLAGLDTAADNMQPDDVLFHELFHAYRAMKGLFEDIPTGDTWDYTEEFFAITATNVYVSENGRGGSLRGDHNLQFHSLGNNQSSWGDQTVGRNFYMENFKLVDQLCEEMPEFTGPLSSIDAGQQVAAWNPFRERILFDKSRANFNTLGSTALDMLSEPRL